MAQATFASTFADRNLSKGIIEFTNLIEKDGFTYTKLKYDLHNNKNCDFYYFTKDGHDSFSHIPVLKDGVLNYHDNDKVYVDDFPVLEIYADWPLGG